MRDLAGRNEELTAKLTEARAELATERTAGAGLRQVIAELSLELQQAREELAAAGNVMRLPVRRNGKPAGPATDMD